MIPTSQTHARTLAAYYRQTKIRSGAAPEEERQTHTNTCTHGAHREGGSGGGDEEEEEEESGMERGE